MEDAILDLLKKQKYKLIQYKEKLPFKILYRENGESILMIALIKKQSDQGLISLQPEFFAHLKQMMQNQTLKPITFSYWVILPGEPGEEERKLALETDNIWFIDEKTKKEYVFDEVNPSFWQLYRQLDALLTGNLKRLRKLQREERKKEYKREWDIVHQKMTAMNTILVAVNIVIFLVVELSGEFGQMLFEQGAMEWRSILLDGQYYRLITCVFLHAGVSHLFGNMLFLFLIGPYLERVVGKVKYMLLYFGSGLGSSIISVLYYRYEDASVLSVGASGTLFGIVGALLYVLIRNRGRLEELSWKSFLIMIIGSISVGFFTVGVDNAAHIGGLIVGFLLAIPCYVPRKKKLSAYSKI